MSEVKDPTVWTPSDLRTDAVRMMERMAGRDESYFQAVVRGYKRSALNEVWIDSPKWLRKRIEAALGKCGRKTK